MDSDINTTLDPNGDDKASDSNEDSDSEDKPAEEEKTA